MHMVWAEAPLALRIELAMNAYLSCNPVRHLCHRAAALLAPRLCFVPPMPRDDEDGFPGLRQRKTHWPAHWMDLIEDAAHLALLIYIASVGLGIFLLS
ncbi:hypothetical protein HNP55_003420 [Paucibacter oligotrophus]|uniref:Uncharacterized protein n=1 Tax=Roseateles oligotrophus TaxID=1769250 RepID=A0A840L8H8_9BURK|nr:hypothetical protein [Roseateles oligotrophus]MBB4844874.1 hypothetical protein [Roseateles oligotrophus]